MKSGLVELAFIIDRSGSMMGLEKETIGGYNSLIERQKKEPGEAFVTTVLFDHEYEVICDHTKIESVQPLTDCEYYPRGCTALLDAIGMTINRIGKRLNETPEEERPEHVIITITTDGMENASKEYSLEQVREMTKHQQEKYSWKFIFLGANMDAIGEAKKMGIRSDFARTNTASKEGVSIAYSAISASVSSMRNTTNLSEDEAMEEASKALDTVI